MKTLPVLLLASTTLHAGGIYWSNRGASLLERSLYDGTGRVTVLSSAGTNVRGLALDLTNNLIYYADNGADILYKLKLDGTSRTTVLSVGPGAFPADLRLNLAAGHLYYCDQQKAHIRRINLDGTNAVTLVTDTAYQPYYLDLDIPGGKIYWGDFDGSPSDSGNVFRMNLDGSGRETVVTGNLQTRGVGVDAAGGYLYWVNRNAGKVMRCRLADLPVNATDTAKAQTLYASLDTPHGMVLDTRAGKIYWVDTATNGTPGTLGDQAVSRGSMDGTGPHEVLVSLGSEPWDIDIDPRCLTYGEWVARFFARNPGAAAVEEADPDRDGIANLMECGLALHPQQPDAVALPAVFLFSHEGAAFPAIRYTRRTGVAKLSVLPQYSTDLDFWWDETSPTDGIPPLVEVSVVPQPENLETVTVRSIFSLEQRPRQYFRMKAILAL